MVDYVVTKENTGLYHNRRSVHMPVDVELQQRTTERFASFIYKRFLFFKNLLSPETNTDLGEFLVKSYAKQIKERNSSTGRGMLYRYFYRLLEVELLI